MTCHIYINCINSYVILDYISHTSAVYEFFYITYGEYLRAFSTTWRLLQIVISYKCHVLWLVVVTRYENTSGEELTLQPPVRLLRQWCKCFSWHPLTTWSKTPAPWWPHWRRWKSGWAPLPPRPASWGQPQTPRRREPGPGCSCRLSQYRRGPVEHTTSIRTPDPTFQTPIHNIKHYTVVPKIKYENN